MFWGVIILSQLSFKFHTHTSTWFLKRTVADTTDGWPEVITLTGVPEAILGVKGDTGVVHHAGIGLPSTPLAVTGHPVVTPYKLWAQLVKDEVIWGYKYNDLQLSICCGT